MSSSENLVTVFTRDETSMLLMIPIMLTKTSLKMLAEDNTRC